MSGELQRYTPKPSGENTKAQRIIKDKLLGNPDFDVEEVAALLASMRINGDPNLALTPHEISILRRNLPYQDNNAAVSEVLAKLQPYLENTVSKPPTFAGKLRNLKDWITDLTTENLVGITGGTIVATLGFAMTAGGLYGGYEILMHLPQMARPLVIGAGVGSIVLDIAGIVTMALGASILRDEIKRTTS